MEKRSGDDASTPPAQEQRPEVWVRLAYLRDYEREFRRLFGRRPSLVDLERAIEQFDPERQYLE